jgi:hypothetical protein
VQGLPVTNLHTNALFENWFKADRFISQVLTDRFGLLWFGSRRLLVCSTVIRDNMNVECLGKVLMDSASRKLRISNSLCFQFILIR